MGFWDTLSDLSLQGDLGRLIYGDSVPSLNIFGDAPSQDNLEFGMPDAASYPIQRSNKATPITIVYGTVRIAGNILWMGDNHPWQTSSSSSGGKGGGGSSSSITDSGNRRSFLIGVCEGPVTISKIWKGKELLSFNNITVFNGDGSDNTGIEALIGENFANYPHTCCVFFNEFEIGAGGTLPNFTFEVGSILLGFANIIYAANNRCFVFDQNYEVIRQHNIIPGCLACDIAINGNYTYTQGVNAPGDQPIFLRDKNGVDLGVIFDEPSVWRSGLWAGVRFSLDGNYIYGAFQANAGNDTLIKWNASTGAKIWEVTPIGTSLANPFHLEIDRNEKLYIRKQFPLIGGNAFDYAGRYDKDGIFDAGWLGIKDLFFSLVDDRMGLNGVAFFTGGFSSFTEFDVVWAVDLETNNIIAQSFGNTDLTPRGFAIASNGDHVYVITSVINGKNLWKCNPDLTVVNSILVEGQPGSGVASLLINKQGQLCLFYTNGELGTRDDIIIYDKDLIRIEGHETSISLGGVFAPDAVQIPKALLLSKTSDENPALIIKDLLTNTRYGAGLDEDTWIDTDSFDATEIYCNENGLRFSFAITRQKPIVDWIDFINSHFQGFVHMSEGKIVLDVYRKTA